MSWPEVKYALNRSLGATEFSPLDVKIDKIARRYKTRTIFASVDYTSTATAANPVIIIDTDKPGILRYVVAKAGFGLSGFSYTGRIIIEIDGTTILNYTSGGLTLYPLLRLTPNFASTIFTFSPLSVAANTAFDFSATSQLNLLYNKLKITMYPDRVFAAGAGEISILLLEEMS